MFQVCFTACFKEEGKETSAGYSIFYYARANARAPGSCEKSTRKQESRRFSISGKGRKREKVPVWLEKTRRAASAKCKRFRMKNRNDGEETRRAPVQNRQKKRSGNQKIPELLKNSPPKKAAGGKIHSGKCEFSLRKVLRKVEKLWIRRKKFPTLYGKNLKMIRKVREKCSETGSGSRKKQAFPSKKFRKSTEKTGMG